MNKRISSLVVFILFSLFALNLSAEHAPKPAAPVSKPAPQPIKPPPAPPKPTVLQVIEKNIIVNGKQSLVYDIVQPDGTFGYIGKKGELFNVVVENRTRVPLVLHWHGIIDPNDQDGVPFVTQVPIQPGESYPYQFKLMQAGTFWLHSHYKLQEQRLMAAPLIVYDENELKEKEPEALMFLQDFSFTDPSILYAQLRGQLQKQAMTPKPEVKFDPTQFTPAEIYYAKMALTHSVSGKVDNAKIMLSPMDSVKKAMAEAKWVSVTKPNKSKDVMPSAPVNHESMGYVKISNVKRPKKPMAKMDHPMQDVSDVKFDAYLTNHKTLQNPSVVTVTPAKTIRLRIINASASSNYYIDLGKLTGTLFAVDAEPIKPIQGSKFQIAIGNRLDIRVQIPAGQGVYPILALPEGTKQQTGLVLATPYVTVPEFPENTTAPNPLLSNDQEMKLQATQPLPSKMPNKSLVYNLQGDMTSYKWTINGQEWPYVTPFEVDDGNRIELVFKNQSGMSHPIHLHGHVFQVTEIDGQKINGRKGDTVNVMPGSTMKVVLDTNNPGIWMLHCHVLYHQMGGMMTTLDYAGYPNKFTTKQRLEGDMYTMPVR